MGFFREALGRRRAARARRGRHGAAHRCRRRSSRSNPPAAARRTSSSTASTSGSGRFTACRRIDGVFISPALASEVGGEGGRRAAHAPAEAVGGSGRVAVRPQGGRRADGAADARRCAAARRLGEFSRASRSRPTCARCSRRSAACSATSRCHGQVNTMLVSGGRADRRRDAPVGAAARRSRRPRRDRSTIRTPSSSRARAGSSATPSRPRRASPPASSACSRFPSSPISRTRIRKGDRQIPYSLVTATDLAIRCRRLRGARRRANRAAAGVDADAIVLNEWAARELSATPGDRIDVDYYLWDRDGRARHAHRARSRLSGVVPIAGLAADRRLAPDYPGITEVEEPGRLGSAVPDRSVARPARGRTLLGRVPDDAEGVHRRTSAAATCGDRATAR